MNNIIKFLEKIGSESEIQRVENDQLEEIAAAYLDGEVKDALANGNYAALETLLSTKFKIHCALFPSKDDEQEPDDDSEKESDDDKEESAQLRVSA